MQRPDEILTFPYKHVDGNPVLLDVYLPTSPPLHLLSSKEKPREHHTISVPAVVYFHGGGLTVGNRRSWFPAWMQKRISGLGYIFICADYRLMPPATGHAILADIKDVFKFVSEDLNRHLEKRQGAIRVNGDATMLENSGADTTTLNHVPTFHVDSGALAVAGTSAGGLCAYLAAVHASPKPKAVASLYAMGGKFLTAHYLTPKTKPFLRGREILDPNLFSQYLYPFNGLLPTSDSPLSYHPPTSPTPGYPANDRMLIGRLQLQLGVVLDYYTGEHEPSLSAFLRERLASLLDNSTPPAQSDDLQSLIPAKHIEIFPEFNVSSDWPPTCLVHGTKDTAVPPQESLHMYGLLKKAGVEVTMMNVEGKEHSFDYEPNADVIHEREFDMIVEFLHRQLDKGREIVV